MRKGLKKWLFSVGLIGLLSAGPLAAELMACCGGDWIICNSDREQFAEDVNNNCDGCTTGTITFIECLEQD